MGLMRNAPAPLALDFAARRRRPGWLGWLALALGVAALALVLRDVQAGRARLAEEVHALERARVVQRAVRGGDAPAAVQPAPPPGALAAARQVAGAINAPWAQVFASLVGARVEDVALLEVHGDAARGSLRLVGLARSLAVAFDYVELLQAVGGLREVRIDSHEWVVAGNVDVVRFTVSAAWGAR